MIAAGVVLLLALLLVVAAPSIASSGYVRGWLAARLTEELGAQATIEEISLSWSQPSVVRGVAVRISEGEFRGDEILRVAEVRLEPGLWRLWRGAESIAVHIAGLHVTVDERGGGRTNLDPFLRRFLPGRRREATQVPAPGPVPEPEPEAEPEQRKLPPLDVTVADSSIRVRRLPYAPPVPPVNPFRDDVPVRPTDEGLDTYQLDSAKLRLQIDGDEVDATTKGSFSHGADTTTFQADVKVRDGVPQGTIELHEFDLELMDPFVAGQLSGRVSARAQGSFTDGRVSATLELDVRDLVTDRLREEWIRATVQVNEQETLYAVHPLEVTSASGRFALAGGLDIPRDEPYRPSGELTGTFPIAMAYRAFVHHPPPIEAQVRFNLKSQLQHEGGHAAGMLYLDHFSEPDNPGEYALAFDLLGDRAQKNLHIDKLALTSAHSNLNVRGQLHHGRRWSLDLAGDGHADLARWKHIADHFAPDLTDFDLAGQCRFEVHSFRRAPDGTLELRADLNARDLEARGIAPGVMEYPELAVHIDASLLEDADRLVIRAGQIQDVLLTGTLHGLRDPGAWPDGEATAKGSFPISPRLVRFLGMDQFRNPQGIAEIDLAMKEAGGNGKLVGTLGVRGLGFQFGDYNHEDNDPAWQGSLDWRDGRVTGAFTLEGPRMQARVRDLLFDPDARTVQAHASIKIPDATPLRELLLDSRWRWSGAHDAEVDIALSPETMRFEGTVHAPRLRFQFDGYGLDGDETDGRALVERENGAWFFRNAEVRVPARKLAVSTDGLKLQGGELSGPLVATGRFEDLHTLVEPLRQLDFRGDFRFATDLLIGTSAEGKLEFDSSEFAIGEKRMEAVTLRVPRLVMARHVEVPRFSLRIGNELTADGSLDLGDDLNLRIRAQGSNLAWVTHFVEGVDGSGAFSVSADIRGPRLRRDGAYALSGVAHVDHMNTQDDVQLDAVALEVKKFTFRKDGGHLHELSLVAETTVARLQRHLLSAQNVKLSNTSSGSILADASGAGHRLHLVTSADWIQIEERKLEGLTLDGTGTLKSLDLDDARSLQVNGRLKFERIPAAVLDWTGGTADFVYRDHVLDVKKLVATVQEGRMTGSAHFDFHYADVPWNVEIRTDDAKLSKNFADPLSYIIPVLRVGEGGNSTVSGFASWEVKLRGIGFAFNDLEAHLAGSGYLRLRDARVKGSLLLPLLSLRIGGLLLHKPFVIPDSTANWRVENGVVTTDPLKISSEPFGIRMGGTVTLRGHLDYIFHPGLLLVPISVKGQWDSLTVLPTARELLPKWPFK